MQSTTLLFQCKSCRQNYKYKHELNQHRCPAASYCQYNRNKNQACSDTMLDDSQMNVGQIHSNENSDFIAVIFFFNLAQQKF